ncbi:MAG: fatty acid desaturase [Cryomorphaceae bacterium]|nr:acyl-CoA desaturase [Flavobacteriales bacterium]
MSAKPVDTKKYRFSHRKDKDFNKTLRERVNAYFTDKGITPHANTNAIVKTIFMLTLYFAPFAALFIFGVTNLWIFFGLWVMMGFGAAGIGVNIMHDANHGAFSSSPRVNKIMGMWMNFIGGSADTWKLQHNVLHHTYTNVEGVDHDIAGPPMLRFSPHQPAKPMHKYQYIYAWFLYGLMTLFRSFVTDFTNAYRFKKFGIVREGKDFKKLVSGVIFWKVIYFGYVLVLPMIFLPVSPWITLLGFTAMHFVLGLTLALIFQCAHVMETCEYPLPNDKGEMDNNWAVHQMMTTTNFSPKNRVFSWFIGGLNYQVEHHLFQHICHVHYRDLSKIVSQTAEEFGIQYKTQKNFVTAVWGHAKMLKQLGTEKVPVGQGQPNFNK